MNSVRTSPKFMVISPHPSALCTRYEYFIFPEPVKLWPIYDESVKLLAKSCLPPAPFNCQARSSWILQGSTLRSLAIIEKWHDFKDRLYTIHFYTFPVDGFLLFFKNVKRWHYLDFFSPPKTGPWYLHFVCPNPMANFLCGFLEIFGVFEKIMEN